MRRHWHDYRDRATISRHQGRIAILRISFITSLVRWFNSRIVTRRCDTVERAQVHSHTSCCLSLQV